jgi:hypothetical protein
MATKLLRYEKLTKSQKKIIDTMIEFFPYLMNSNSIQSKELNYILKEIRKKGVKISYPLFLRKHYVIQRGLYPFPGSNSFPVEMNVLLIFLNLTEEQQEFYN